MNGKKIEVRPLSGINELYPQPVQAATKLKNWTTHQKSGGWDNRIGYEKYIPGTTNLYSPFQSLGRIDSMFIWSRHAGAQEWILLESGGKIYYLQDFCSPTTIEELATGRNIPAPTEPLSSFIPFGRFLVILNGYEAPIKYAAWPVLESAPSVPVYPLGWEVPPPPAVWDVDTDPTTLSGEGKSVGIAAEGAGTAEYGKGSTTSSVTNSYRWKVSFVNNAGSESPVSNPSNTVEWITPSGGSWSNRRFVPYMEIPIGPAGTVARRIYCTKNMGNGDDMNAEVYYFAAQVNNNIETGFYDHWSDNQLGSEAPGAADVVAIPCRGARFGAQFKSCLFLDGGTSQGTRLYWSLPGKPDSFSALDFADVGSRDGGEITGFYAHYNFLIVFRERAIDIVRGTYGSFEVRPLAQGIGTKAHQTATNIPDLGVVFLATDGVYLIGGNVDGGGSISIKKLSEPIFDTIARMNKDLLSRAVGCYSQKWREYHVYFAADGADRPNVGIVLHVDKGAWSIREGFPVGAIATNDNGDIIFGHHTGYTGAPRVPAGLFVVSRRCAAGSTVVTGGTQEQPTYSTEDASALTSVYKSAWHDFGDPAEKKDVLYVYLHAYTMGDNEIKVTTYKDYSYTGVDHPAIVLQRADFPDQGLLDTAVLGTNVWEDHLITTYRVGVHAGERGQAGGACGSFAFEVTTTNPMVLVGYSLEYTIKGQTVINAKRAT